nr:hypothetical protein [Tanacetum cinerariifolium]
MAIASIWTDIANWSTPTILFCLLNLMIAIIFIASNFGNSHQGNSPRHLTRSPSMLERVKSVDLSSFYSFALSEQVSITKELTRAPSFLDRVKSFKLTSPFKSNSPPDETFTSQDEHFDVPPDRDVIIETTSPITDIIKHDNTMATYFLESAYNTFKPDQIISKDIVNQNTSSTVNIPTTVIETNTEITTYTPPLLPPITQLEMVTFHSPNLHQTCDFSTMEDKLEAKGVRSLLSLLITLGF